MKNRRRHIRWSHIILGGLTLILLAELVLATILFWPQNHKLPNSDRFCLKNPTLCRIPTPQEAAVPEPPTSCGGQCDMCQSWGWQCYNCEHCDTKKYNDIMHYTPTTQPKEKEDTQQKT